PREPHRQPASADDPLPARGRRGLGGARLCQGQRADDGDDSAFERRPAERQHGDLQRVVRSGPDADPGRDRTVGRGEAPPVDRLDPHRVRSGRAGPRLHQMGQPAGLGARGVRRAPACRANGDDGAVRSDVRQPRRRAAGVEARREADVILALDWIDLTGTLKQVYGDRPIGARIVAASCDVHVHRGFSMDYFGLPPVDVNLLAEPDVVVPLLLEACKARPIAAAPASAPEPSRRVYDVLSRRAVASALNEATEGVEVCLIRLPLGWPGEARHFSHPLDYLGGDGGAGVGAGPGITVGAGLALKGSGRIPIGLIGDGDYLMGLTALWTAAHYQIPCLFIVCNNRSFYNDEAHQDRVPRMRGRPVENKWI